MKTTLSCHTAFDPIAALEAAAGTGYGGILFASLLDVSDTLDAVRLAAWRRRADDLGLAVRAGLGWFNPQRPGRAGGTIALGGGDLVAGVAEILTRMADLGLNEPFFTIGMIEDRLDDGAAWREQLEAVAFGIDRLAPTLRRLGMSLLLKTHEEITTHEILRLIERVGADLVNVALDPVNLVVRLEDPLAGTQRLAPFVRQIHLDDASVHFEAGRLRRRLRAMGAGDIPWDAILALAPDADLWVETHRGAFSMDAFDPAWLALQPEIALAEYAKVVGMAVTKLAEATPDDTDPQARLPAYRPWLETRGLLPPAA